MFAELRSVVDSARALVREFEPLSVDGAGAMELVELFGQLEHVAAAGKGIAARRVDETGAYRESGARSASHWLAATSGTTVGAAVRTLDAVRAMRDLSATDAAFRAGELSEHQAHEITEAAKVDPQCEERLLGTAQRSPLRTLREDAREVRNRARNDAEWAQYLHDSRAVSTWTEPDGAVRADVRLAPDAGGEVLAALDAETDLVFREAREAGSRDARASYMADALVNLVLRGPRRPTRATLIVDEAAITRGFAAPGERCEIQGVGPVPVTTARAMLSHATVRTMTIDGLELDGIDTGTRYIPAELRRWLDATYPTCGVEGCDVDHGLEYDHVVPVSEGGPTTKDNLWRLCRYHHRLKTTQGWRVRGEPHRWVLEPPARAP